MLLQKLVVVPRVSFWRWAFYHRNAPYKEYDAQQPLIRAFKYFNFWWPKFSGRKKTEEKEHTLPLLEFFKQIQSAQETKSANDGIVPQEENFQGLQETTSVYDMRECDDKGVVAVAGDGPSTSGVGVSSSTKQEPKRRKAHAPSRVPTGIALHNLTKQGFSKWVLWPVLRLEGYFELICSFSNYLFLKN